MMADFINWEVMLDQSKTSRGAGSHVNQLANMFVDSRMIASESDNNYQGDDSVVFLFTPPNPDIDPKIVLINSYFGSCSYCDSWEDAKDDSLKEVLIAIANNARTFDSFDEIGALLDEIVKKLDSDEPYGEYYNLHDHAHSLLKQIKEAEIKLGDGSVA
jgi:hypothetical protein